MHSLLLKILNLFFWELFLCIYHSVCMQLLLYLCDSIAFWSTLKSQSKVLLTLIALLFVCSQLNLAQLAMPRSQPG